MPLIDTEDDFRFIRDHLMNKPTPTEHQIASRIGNTIELNSNDTVDDPLVKQRLHPKSKSIDQLIIHYTHEARLRTSKKDMYELWNRTFKNTSIMNKLCVAPYCSHCCTSTRNCYLHCQEQYSGQACQIHISEIRDFRKKIRSLSGEKFF